MNLFIFFLCKIRGVNDGGSRYWTRETIPSTPLTLTFYVPHVLG